MTASDPNSHATRFVALEQADFQRLEHAGYRASCKTRS